MYEDDSFSRASSSRIPRLPSEDPAIRLNPGETHDPHGENPSGIDAYSVHIDDHQLDPDPTQPKEIKIRTKQRSPLIKLLPAFILLLHGMRN